MTDLRSPPSAVTSSSLWGMRRISRGRAGRSRSGFSLIELIVVMVVVLTLTGLLLPTLGTVRENARRVYCKSNLHQIGLALSMYANDYKDWLPESQYGNPGSKSQPNGRFRPQDMMAVHRGEEDPSAWEGLGLLFRYDYCTCAQCFYCPSHHGTHEIEVYQHDIDHPGKRQVFGNYQYAGHLIWTEDPPKKRKLDDGHRIVLVTDGLRTARDFNHRVGMNVLRGDLSVQWQYDVDEMIYGMLPPESDPESSSSPEQFGELWDFIEDGPGPGTGPTITH